MTLVQEIHYTQSRDGEPDVDMADWVATLSSNEQLAFKRAQVSQATLEEALVTAGKLTVTFTPIKTLTWATEEDKAAGTGSNPLWDAVVARYAAATGMVREIVEV
jgi:hypothetical protein